MGRWVTRFWENTHEGGLRRRDRRSGEYRAYVPDPLVGAALVLSPSTETLAARAETRVRALGALPDMAGIARFLLRSEAIASSRIEGMAPSAHRVALAELAQQEEVRGLSEQARAVARNVTLMRAAVEELSGARPVTADRLLALHHSLLPDSPEHHGIRSTQNWVGGSSYHPLDADFVPPPPELVPDLVADLLTYLNGATHAPLIQAALVHAQFETIHSLRADSAASRILSGLPGTPVLTIQTASRIYGVSRTAASRGLETLRSAGILTTESIGANRRAYTARSVLDTITWAERRLAGTRFDTRTLRHRPRPRHDARRHPASDHR